MRLVTSDTTNLADLLNMMELYMPIICAAPAHDISTVGAVTPPFLNAIHYNLFLNPQLGGNNGLAAQSLVQHELTLTQLAHVASHQQSLT